MFPIYANASEAPEYTPEDQQAAVKAWFAYRAEILDEAIGWAAKLPGAQ
jgi:hypothetical protein